MDQENRDASIDIDRLLEEIEILRRENEFLYIRVDDVEQKLNEMKYED